MAQIKELIGKKDVFRVAYLGGSITEGAGAECKRTAYTSVVTCGLRERFPQVKIMETNAGIGGTGSDLGMFRLKKDVLSKNPDMVFIEFAVNDAKVEKPEIFMESIVRRLRKEKPDILIVFVYTTCEAMNRDYQEGRMPAVVAAHEAVAQHYHIPSVHAGQRLYEKIRKEQCGDRRYLPDGVHPNDEGHEVYGREILRVLMEAEFDILKKEALSEVIYEAPDLFETADFKISGWHRSYAEMCRRLPNYLYCNVPGTEMEITFYGSIIGLFWTVEKDSGSIYYTIDSQEECFCSAWDHFANQFPRTNYCILARNLREGKHKLNIRVAEIKDDQSEGYYIRIGAVLADGKIAVKERI